MAATVPVSRPQLLAPRTVAAARTLADLADTPQHVQQAVGAQLLYALGLRTRPTTTPQEGETR